MEKESVLIVGAGLAGLAAAYELAKTNKYTITIIEERDRIGGRTFTANSQGTSADVGGFIIYTWYKNFHRILKELSGEYLLKPIPKLDILYDLTGNATWTTEKNIPISLTTKGRLATKLLPVLVNNVDVAHPNLESLQETTVETFLNKALPLKKHNLFKTYLDIVCQGYCYPPLHTYQAAFMLPMMGSNLFFGDISEAFFFPNGMQTLHKLLKTFLEERGATFVMSTKVIDVKHKKVTTKKKTYVADKIIVTHPIKKEIDFTHFVTVTVLCDGKLLINRKATWGALFLHPTTCKDPNILSIINSRHLYGIGMKNTLTLNIKLGDKEQEPTPSAAYEKHIAHALKKIFPSIKNCKITSYTHWQHTMPISTSTYVKKLRESQGKDGIFYAGDYLGCPSMETAITTGVDAANLIKNS